jgi:hypothetical protein
VGPARIVLGNDSGTFWTGVEAEPWSDDPKTAKAYDSPREAWTAALGLRQSESEYLDDSPVELHLFDPEDPLPARRIISTAAASNRPLMRSRWKAGFKEALPPDLPGATDEPVAAEQRLREYFDDIDWDVARSRATSPGGIATALDPAVWASLSSLRAKDESLADSLLNQHVPAHVAQAIRKLAEMDPDLGEPTRDREGRAGQPEPNEISKGRDREPIALGQMPASGGPSGMAVDGRTPATAELPAFVERHFVRAGQRFYYRQRPEQLAFESRGDSFRAHDVSVSVATAMVDMAVARGWESLKVRGSKDFRRLVWTAAAKRGLAVDGYSPSSGERAMVEQHEEARAHLPRGDSPDSRLGRRERERPTDPLAGVLVEHGPAPFQHQQGNVRSYFVSLRDRSGDVTTHWGLDLERAMGESGSAVGDQVQLARHGRKRVQVREPIRNDAGFVIDYETKETERTAWSVTVHERGKVVRGQDGADPLAAKVVELFTAKRLATLPAEDRVRFRELYRQAKARLEEGERAQEAPGQPLNEVSRHRDRERGARG